MKETSSEEVAAYLKEHPSFFEQNSLVLEYLKIPHGNEGQVVSLLEYQVALVKKKYRKLQQEVKDLLSIAQDNEKLLRSTLQFSVHLLNTASLPNLVEKTEESACQLFKVEAANIRLFENESFAWPIEAGVPLSRQETEFLFGPFFSANKPWCGPLYIPQLYTLFGEKAEQIASVGLVILKTTTAPLGVFALGSYEKTRFHAGMETLFLEFIGNILSHRIALFYAAL